MSTKSKTGKPKHRKILRDTVQGLVAPQFKRLLRRAGVVRINNLIYEESRGVVKIMLEEILKSAHTIMEYRGKKRVQAGDIFMALEIMGEDLAIPLYRKKVKGEKVTKSTKRTKSAASPTKSGGVTSEKRAHKFKNGTVALREVRKYQKSGQLIFAKASFRRFVLELLQDMNRGFMNRPDPEAHISKKALHVVQTVIEWKYGKIGENALLIAINAGRTTITPKDIQLARKIKGDFY